MTSPHRTGRDHWLEAERLLRIGAELWRSPDKRALAVARANVHALLALAAPAYAFHQAPRQAVADSPNITPGENEAPVPYRGSSAP
jgi:hypothetical protein